MKIVKKNDVIIIIVTIVTAVLGFLMYNLVNSKNTDTKVAVIYYRNDEIKRINLNEGKEYEFSIDGHENVVFKVYEDGTISFIESDCPDKVCINSGKLSMTGQSAACLPNMLFLKIVDEAEQNSDNHDIIV